MWSIDRFNARKGNQLTDARMSLPTESHSTAESKLLLEIIDREKLQVGYMIGTAIDGSWIGYANAMGLVYREHKTAEWSQIGTVRDLRLALRQLVLKERLAALYFLTGYTRDELHAQVMWGATHQTTVEDYVMDALNASFSIQRSEMKGGHRTCVGQLYSQIYNRKKQKLQQSVLPAHTAVAVGSNGFKPKTNWKRPKTNYFVHTSIANKDEVTRVVTDLVSDEGWRMEMIIVLTNMCFNAFHYKIDGHPTGIWFYQLENWGYLKALHISTRPVKQTSGTKRYDAVADATTGRHHH